MNLKNRNLLILFNTKWSDEEAIEKEVKCLSVILKSIESPEKFCTAFELVNRNSITDNQKIILKESKYLQLRPFRFLINKN